MFVATDVIRLTTADISLGDSSNPDDANLYLDFDDNQLSSDGSALLDPGFGVSADADFGEASWDSTFLADSSPSLALNDDQTNSFQLADELGNDLCDASPGDFSPSNARMRTRTRDTVPKACSPSSGQGQDQPINQLSFPNIFNLFKPKKMDPDTQLEPLGPPPFSTSPTGQDGNSCPVARPVHLCCLLTDPRGANIIGGFHIDFYSLSACSIGT